MIDECYTRLIWSGKVNPIFLILLIPKSFWCKYPPKLKITPPGSDIKAVHFHLLNIKLFFNSFPGKTGKIALARGSQGNPPSYISIPNLPTPSASQPSPVHTPFPLVGFAACLQGLAARSKLMIYFFSLHCTDPGKQMPWTPWNVPILTPSPSSFQTVIVPASREIKRH